MFRVVVWLCLERSHDDNIVIWKSQSGGLSPDAVPFFRLYMKIKVHSATRQDVSMRLFDTFDLCNMSCSFRTEDLELSNRDCY